MQSSGGQHPVHSWPSRAPPRPGVPTGGARQHSGNGCGPLRIAIFRLGQREHSWCFDVHVCKPSGYASITEACPNERGFADVYIQEKTMATTYRLLPGL